MNLVTPTMFLALAGALGSVSAADDVCAVPVIPTHSVSSECVARVEQQVREWRLCVEAYRAANQQAAPTAMDQEVDARVEKWLLASRVSAGGELERQRTLNRIDRERTEYLAKKRARVVYATERK